MPKTRKKIIKTVYKSEECESETGDFSDSGSEANIPEASSSEEENGDEDVLSSGDDFRNNARKKKKVVKPPIQRKKPKFTKNLVNKINKQVTIEGDDDTELPASQFTVKDLTEADKLLPSFLNLSESDSSEDESRVELSKKQVSDTLYTQDQGSDNHNDDNIEYRDVWSSNIQDNSEDIAKKTFMELEKHNTEIEQTKASIASYVSKNQDNQNVVSKNSVGEFNVKDLLAQGEEVIQEKIPIRKRKAKRKIDDSESEVEDWEEVNENKSIPQQGLQLFVELPNAVKKSKKIDVDMMMKRKINKVKKENQVYMHQVHVLCWLGHGIYVSQVLNDQEIMAAALAIVPKGCYPGERLTTKYVEQITAWFKDKLTLKQNKHEHKFRPKAPKLKNTLLSQIKSRVTTSKKYNIFIFVSMLRALGLQCRVMFNFVTVPIRPPSSELCSLSNKSKHDTNKTANQTNENASEESAKITKTKAADKSNGSINKKRDKKIKSKAITKSNKVADVYVIHNSSSENDSEYDNIVQLDGGDDTQGTHSKSRMTKKVETSVTNLEENDVLPPKRAKLNVKLVLNKNKTKDKTKKHVSGYINSAEPQKAVEPINIDNVSKIADDPSLGTLDSKRYINAVNITDTKRQEASMSQGITARNRERSTNIKRKLGESSVKNKHDILKTNTADHKQEFIFKSPDRKAKAVADADKNSKESKGIQTKTSIESAPGTSKEKSKYFVNEEVVTKNPKRNIRSIQKNKEQIKIDKLRVSHKDLTQKAKPKNDVTGDLIDIISNRIKVQKAESKKRVVIGQAKEESDDDNESHNDRGEECQNDSDEDFKPTKSPRTAPRKKLKISPKAGTSKRIDRRVLSSDEDVVKQKKMDVWCEVFVEELELWVAIDVMKGKVHCTSDLITQATHPICYVVGWDNNNYLKDLTRRYVPHWNTVTRKQRAGPLWWSTAIQPWIGPGTARDKEEDEYLDRMQLEAPLPKSIAEYKNHPLYVLKRHLLKFEVLYPPDSATSGFVRGEAVYHRSCVHTCHSRDKWLKEAKVVKVGEKPYKVVKARPKWDKLSNKMITDKLVEVFGPWQVQDYEPPTADHGIVPRNAYGNVELFKDCMLPKGTVHIKLPGLNKIAKTLNIDCAPAMTGFDYSGGYSHPVYNGFVVCEEFKEIIMDAWIQDQGVQERKEREKIDLRVYKNWRRLIRGLMIRRRLQLKYGFDEPTTSQAKPNVKGPRLVVKKK